MIQFFFRLTSKKAVRYIISGGTAAFVSLALLYLLTDVFGFWYLLSSAIAFIFAFIVSFTLQKFWTFQDKQSRAVGKQLVFYFGTALSGLALNSFLLYTLVELFGLWYMLAQAFSIGVVAIATFFIYQNIVFNQGEASKEKHILVATGLYPPQIGGPATYSSFLEEELPRRNIAVKVLPFNSVRSFPKPLRHAFYFLKTLFHGTGSSFIYALDPVSVGFPALIAAKILRKHFLIRVAGDYAWEQLQQRETLLEKFRILNFKSRNKKFITLEQFQEEKFDLVTELRRKIEHFVTRHAGVVVVPSHYLKEIVKQWGISEEKIKVIYNSFELPVLKITKEEARKKLEISGTVIFSAGRLVPWKGFPALIDCIAELKNEIPDIKLYIAGDGPQEADLRFQISDLRMDDTVILLGKLPYNKWMQYIQTADVFVLNTGYEGFSHQLLEVMALGIPIITTLTGGNQELIEDQKTGIFVTYNDKEETKRAIQAIIKDRELRDTLILNGTERARSFSKERAVSSLLKIF